MAQENNSQFTGTRFAMDATNSRQYAIPFALGKASTPFLTKATDARDEGFKPNEVIFALDDDVVRQSNKTGIVFSMVMYKIGTDATGKPSSFNAVTVNYQAKFNKNEAGDGYNIVYQMLQADVDTLKEAGFKGFPQTFRDKLKLDEPGVKVTPTGLMVDPDFLAFLSFPPHHMGVQAHTIRFEVENKPKKEGPSMSKPNEDTPEKKPQGDFNNKALARRDQAAYKISDLVLEESLKTHTKDLTALAAAGKLDPVIGRDEEMNQAIRVLSRRKQSSLCFTGDAGVGKTAMFYGLAQRIINNDNLPEKLENARVLELDLTGMNAGTKYRGDFEEKLKPLVDGLMEREGVFKGQKIVLCIDELHSQLTAGMASGGTDSGNIMKPFLTGRGICVLGTTTDSEYKKHIEKDSALARRFEKLPLLEPTVVDTRMILKGLWPVIKADHKMTKDLTDADFDYIITMTNRYGANQAQPSKSEKVIDMACSSAACARRNYVSKDDILSAVAQMGGVSVSYLNQSKHDLILKMREELPKKILGQPTLEKIIDGIEGAYAGLNPPNKPMGCYLIQGPAGTGKTETAKALARYLFDDENALVQLNMAEYMEKHTVSRLIGAPAGYVGHDSTESTLLDPVAKKRRCVVLLDEVEKAHPEVFGVLLGILNDGSTKDQQGKNVSFTDVIFIMTTNKGAMEAAKVLENTADMGKWSTAERSPAEIAKALDESYAAAAKSIFPGRPEMLDRIKELGALVTYVPLTKPVIEQMVDMEIQSMNKLFSTTATVGMKNVTIELSQDAKQQLADAGYDSTVGARPLKGEVRRQVGNPLGAWLMNPANEQAIAAVVAEHGSAKIVLTTIGKNLAPQIVKGDAPKVAVVNEAVSEVVNDNVAENAPVAVNKQVATVRKPKI